MPDRPFYLHIPKTGGTSVVTSLGGIRRVYPWVVPKNVCVHVTPEGRRVSTTDRFGRDHISPDDLVGCGHVGGEFFEGRPVLCTVRDPVDRFISELNHRNKSHPTSVNDLIDTCANASPEDNFEVWSHCRPQSDFVATGDRQWCTHVVPIDHIDTTLSAMLDEYGIKMGKQRRMKAEQSPDRKAYDKSDLNDHQRQWVHDFYREDFELFDRAQRSMNVEKFSFLS